MAKGKTCAGCGAEAKPTQTITENGVSETPGVHPWVGVGHEDLDGPGGEPEKFVEYDVCDACHRDPAHRTQNKLKVHFFPRAQRKMAVMAAKEQVLLDDATPEQAAKQKAYLANRKKQ